MMNYDVAIIGAGASGLMTALKIKNKSVVLLDGNAKVGKKLLLTGNGRCNIANKNISAKNFHGDVNFIADILKEYPIEKIENEFEKIAVYTKSDSEGRMYPLSMQAQTVQKALLDCIKEKNVDIKLEFKAVKVTKSKDMYKIISSDDKQICCKNLVVACGGKASAKNGFSAESFEIIKNLGHTFSKLNPALTGFKCDDKILKSIAGVRSVCSLSLMNDNKVIHKEKGEVTFSDKGFSGICVFNLSVHAVEHIGKNLSVKFDLIPEMSEDEFLNKLFQTQKNRPQMPSSSLLDSFFNWKLADAIMKKTGIRADIQIKNLKINDLKKVVNLVKSFELKIKELGDWDNAQVMSGGVPFKELNPKTLESKINKSLYFTGEVINIHGDCGGYNLYWAWTSSLVVANAINRNR